MTDFADLALRVDARGLVQGEQGMDRLAKAGARTERATAAQTAAMSGRYAAFASKAVGALSAVGVAMLATFGSRAIVRESERYELRMHRINAIIKATGGVAGRTAEQLEDQAQALARASLESVDGIQRAQQTLLTFRNIRGEVFDEAIQAAMDLSAAIGTDLNSSILQIAKALEDPVTGMTALTRSGTVFTQAQKDMVKAMVETGRVAEAQAFILGELESQYGGAARAAPRLMSAQDSLAQSIENLLRAANDAFGITDLFASIVEAVDRAVISITANMDKIAVVFGTVAGSAAVLAGVVAGKLVVSLVAAGAQAIWAGTSGFAVLATNIGLASAASVTASVAVSGLSGALVAMRGVLITTGFGALIVGAGYLAYQFTQLVAKAGGFGEAMGALGNVATAVWEQIKLSAASIAPSLDAVWHKIQAGFYKAVRAMQRVWAGFLDGFSIDLGNLVDTPVIGGAFEGAFNAVNAAAARAGAAVLRTTGTIEGFEDAADSATLAAQTLATLGAARTKTAMDELRAIMNGTATSVEETATAAEAAAAALAEMGDAASGVGGAANKVSDLEMETNKLADTLANQVVDGAMSALDAFLDFAFRGFKDFKQFAQSILKVFTDMIKQMIMTAARNKITIPIVTSLTGGLGGAANAAGAVAGAGGGLLGALGTGVFGAAGGITGGTGLLGGLGATLNATFGAGGGLGGLFTIGANAGLAGGGMLAGIGAALPVLGIAAGVGLLIYGFLNKKEEVIEEGLKGIITIEDSIFDTYKKIETSRLFGLLKTTRTEKQRLSDRDAEPLVMAVNAVRDDILSSAEALGVSAGVFEGFSYEFTTSLEKMDAAAKQAAIENELGKMANAMAEMAFDSTEQLDSVREMGEDAADTLRRLSSSLVAVNSAWELMDFRLRDVSIAGGAAASNLVNLVGGLDAFNSATDFFYQNFFSTQERVAKATEQLTEALAEFGLELPSSRRAFREMVEMSVSSQSDDLTAALLKMAPTFAFITEQVDRFNDATNSLFRTRAEQVFAQTAEGYRKPIETVLSEEEKTLLRDIVTAIREGDINNARLTAQLVAIQQRQELEPTT